MRGEQVSRAEVLAYRAEAHDLDYPAASPATCGVLDVGVQDTPAGATAHRALAARSMSTDDEVSTLPRGLVLVHSLRGAMHVHRDRDLGLLATALRPDDATEGDAVDRVAQAMAEVMADDRSRSKGELSTQVTPLLPERLSAWCASCNARHVPDGLFRVATLPAGLRLRASGNRSANFYRAAAPDPDNPEPARQEVVRRFLRRCGPAAVKDLATWTGTAPPTARKWWNHLLASELVEVRVDGKRLWMHTEDLTAARAAPTPTAVRLLPPYDPLAEVAHRELLLPDPASRKQVWRAVANPGLVLMAGELAGTWRRRKQTITLTALTPLSTKEQRAIREEAMKTMPGHDVAFDG